MALDPFAQVRHVTPHVFGLRRCAIGQRIAFLAHEAERNSSLLGRFDDVRKKITFRIGAELLRLFAADLRRFVHDFVAQLCHVKDLVYPPPQTPDARAATLGDAKGEPADFLLLHMAPGVQRVKPVDNTAKDVVFFRFVVSKDGLINGLLLVPERFKKSSIGRGGAKGGVGQHPLAKKDADQAGMNAGSDDVVLQEQVPRGRGGTTIPEQLDVFHPDLLREEPRVDRTAENRVADDDDFGLLLAQALDRLGIEIAPRRDEMRDKGRAAARRLRRKSLGASVLSSRAVPRQVKPFDKSRQPEAERRGRLITKQPPRFRNIGAG